MSDVFVIVFFLSTLIGLKKPIIGGIAGTLIGAIVYVFSKVFEIQYFILYMIFGFIFGYVSPVAVRWFFSGFRGGRGKSEPGVTYYNVGGFGTARSGQFFGECPGGIIPNHDEEAEWMRNKHVARERWIMIALRYVLAPIVLIALILIGILMF